MIDETKHFNFRLDIIAPDSKSSPATLLRQLILCYDVIKGLKALPRMACEDQGNLIFVSLGMRTFPQLAQFSVNSPIVYTRGR